MYADKPKLHQRERNRCPGDLPTLVLDVTTKCNMRCEHCYAFLDVPAAPLTVVKDALDQAYELGVTHYVLMGGEPIAEPKRLEFVLTHCHPDESYINITTNGWAMTRKRIRWLKERQVDKLAVSLDSGIAAEHDAIRRPGSFERTTRMVGEALEEGLIVSLDVVVTHESLYSEGFRKAYELAKSLGVRLDLQIAEPVGNWEGREELLITPEDAAFIRQLRAESPPTKLGDPTIRRDIFRNDGCDHCPAGTGFLHITAHGDVLPCNFLQFSLGNIADRPLKQMRDDLLTHPLFASTSHAMCLPGEDEDFIAKYLTPHVGEPKPLDAYEVFQLRRTHSA